MKDNFSTLAADYARYRPAYPEELFAFLDSLLPERGRAWDCGTGNGQVAVELAKRFREVYASDLSRRQLDHAVPAENIVYSCQEAEKTHYPRFFFDLVTVAQAIHWFDFKAFYAEVRRTAKPGALLAVMGYSLLQVSPEVDRILRKFHDETLAPYWDPERRYVDEQYQTIPFPFEELKTPVFSHTPDWSLAHLLAYFDTWSAVKHYKDKQGRSPVELIAEELKIAWGEPELRKVSFPVLLRIGRIK